MDVLFSCLVSAVGLITAATGFRHQPFDRDVEPLRSFLSILENPDVDRRTLGQLGMQPAVVNDGGIGRKYRRLDRWPARVGETP